MTDNKENPNRIFYPNTYQSPNFYIDDLLTLLSGEEWKCMSFLIRKTLGWHKKSDRLAKSVICRATGLAESTVDRCMSNLISFGLVLRIDGNNSSNEGIEYGVQMEDEHINWPALEKRKIDLANLNKKRTESARKALSLKVSGVGLSDKGTPVGQGGGRSVGQGTGRSVGQGTGRSVGQGTQNPLKPKETTVVAVAPERGMTNPNTGRHTDAKVLGDPMDGMLAGAKLAAERDADLNNRVNDFPPDCHETLRTLIKHFAWPSSVIPEKPAKQSKGGTYAQWINEIRELNSLAGDLGQRVILAAAKASKDLTISHPSGITWAIAGEAGKLSKVVDMPVFNGVQTPFAQSLNNRTPKDPATEERLKSMRAKLQRAKA